MTRQKHETQRHHAATGHHESADAHGSGHHDGKTNHDGSAHHGKDDEKYTKPELREKIKAEVREGDKGGRPGQWSARKSQLLVHEYEKRGGGYTTEQRDDD